MKIYINVLLILLFSLYILKLNIFAQTPFWEKTSGPYACRIWDITPVKDQVVYIGTQGQGIYKSEDTGLSWTQIKGNLDVESVNSIAVNDSGHIFISCENADLTSGIYRSIDQGNNWTEIFPLKGKISIYNEDTLFIATKYNSIFRSDNNGTDWISLAEQPSTPWAIWDVVVDTSGNLWAASPGYVTSDISLKQDDYFEQESDEWLQGVYFSSDKGMTWNNLTGDNPNFSVTNIITNSLGTIITSGYPEYDYTYFWSRNFG